MTPSVQGTCDPAFAAVKDAFASNFDAGLETGASLAVGVNGRVVVDIWAGYTDEAETTPWERDTVACIFSCTKGIVAVLAALLVDR
ncbi:MAG: serine hydrolase, partial [Actinobacteria bacterium]|nr:serine hydrolase [Actinomycetota bacterium]